MKLLGINLTSKKMDIVTQTQIRRDIQQFYEKPIAQVSVELISSILIVIVFAVFALRPTLLTMSELLAEIDEKRQLNDDLQQKVAALSTAQSEWSVRQQEVEKLQQAFFINPSLEDVMLYMEFLSRQEDVYVESVVPPKSIPLQLQPKEVDLLDTQLTRHQVALQIEGSYDQVLNFLRRLEQLQPIYTVDSVSLQVNKPESPWQLNGTIALGLYSYDDAAVTDKVASGVIESSSDTGGADGL